ncbi:MAG: molybdate ABC transporter substrate-binding protein [Devosia nanyangense]|uniref:Molybdate ABC transporter substrate-binding protein n=1 Tax=Devosia nanyangense TaxID=1228055 RepID=A0A933NXS2_9HYPH|nr:molybdate ABC transporter substrate-binding protein [Devosia nanyangense]
MVGARGIGALAVLLLSALPAHAALVRAAVAANFTKVATELAARFQAATGNEVRLSFGATGALYAQITQGAPFDALLSADDRRTATAIAEGLGVPGTEFTYAVGRLALYSPLFDLTDGEAVLRAGDFQHIAIADPKTAPYGAAAMAMLEKFGLTEGAAPRIVTGESISQALAFVESGSAELGLVALSQVVDKPATQIWLVPPENYPAIRQNAVLLKAGETNEAARAFLDYLRGDAAIAVIKAAGYTLE